MAEAERSVKLVVQQAQFLPWAGFWHKMISCDAWIVYAGVQFNKGGHANRVQIGGRWVTIPVERTGLGTLMTDVRIADLSACRKLAQTIRQQVMHKRAPYRNRLAGVVSWLERWTSPSLLELTTLLMEDMMLALGIRRDLVIDTTEREGAAVENLDRCMRSYMAPDRVVYLAGRSGLDYMGYDSLTYPEETWFQQMHDCVDTNSVLQLIANHPTPLDVITTCGHWMTKEGQRREWNEPQIAGDRPAR